MTRDRSADPAGEGRFIVPVQAAAPDRASALEQVYRAHYRDVYRYVLSVTRSPVDAEDIAAETFERAYRVRDALPHPALPWLLLTARRIATDRWRRARRAAAIALRLGTGRPSDAGEGQTEFWLWFDAIAHVLTARQREALALRYQRDLTDADIAKIMGISESGVRSLISRALEALRSHPELL